jgi:hypothetical protein
MFRYKLEEEKEGRFTQAGKKGGLAQAGGSETMKLLRSNLLPKLLKKGGVIAAVAGILLNAGWFYDWLTGAGDVPESQGVANEWATLTASEGGSFTAEVGFLSSGDPAAMGPTATLGQLQTAIDSSGGIEYYAQLGANGSDAFMETWKLAISAPDGTTPLPPSTPLQEVFGVTQGGVNPELASPDHGGPGMHPDLQLTGEGVGPAIGWVTNAATSIAFRTALVAGVTSAGLATTVLVPLGIAAVTGGYLVGWLRKKAAEEGGSRAELLAALIDEMPDVDEAGAPSEATPERPEEAAPGEEESAWGPPEYTDKDLLNTKNIWSFIEIYSAITKQEGQNDDYGAVMTKKSLDEFASSRLPLSVPDAKKVAGYIQEKFQKHWIELLISSGTAAAKEEWDDWWDDRQEEPEPGPEEEEPEGEEEPFAGIEDWTRGADEAVQDIPGVEDLKPEEEEPEPGPEEEEPEGEEEPEKERQDLDYEDFWDEAKTYASKNPMIQDAFFKSPQAKRKLGAIFNLFKDLEPDKETYNFQDTERGPRGPKRRTDQVGALREGIDFYNIMRDKHLEKRPELKRLNVRREDILLAIALFYQAYSLPDNYFIFQGKPGKLSREKTRKKYLTAPPGGWKPELMDDDPNKPRDVKLKTPQGNVQGKESRGFGPRTSARGAPLAPFEEHLKLQEQKTLNRWKVIAGIIKG